MHFADSTAQSDLHDLSGTLRIVAQSRDGEPIESREIVLKKPIKGFALTRKQLFYKPFIVKINRHRIHSPSTCPIRRLFCQKAVA
jgi:hypothetical protein